MEGNKPGDRLMWWHLLPPHYRREALGNQASGSMEGISDTQDNVTKETCNINDLPDEVLLYIFSYLSVTDLALGIQHVCCRWSELSTSDVLWNDLVFDSLPPTDREILSVLKVVPKLQCLDMVYATPEILDTVAECCKNIRKLKFELLHPNEGSEVFKKLVSQCTKLEELSIPGRTLYDEEVFEHVAKWTSLRALRLTGRFPRPVRLKPIADGCPSLQEFYMGEAIWTHFELEYFLEKKKNSLQGLGIMPTSEDNSCAIFLLTKCGNSLRELRLECCPDGYTPTTFSAIKTMSSLKSLTLMFTYGLTVDILESVFIENCMSQLLKLEINNGEEVNDRLVNIICMNCPNLLRLGLQSSYNLNDEGLRYLNLCKNLEELDLRDCTSLTNAAMTHVSRCTKLKYLNISECEIKKEGLQHLLHLSELRQLDMVRCDVSGLPINLFPLYLRKLRKLTFESHRGIDEELLAVTCRKMPRLRVQRL